MLFIVNINCHLKIAYQIYFFDGDLLSWERSEKFTGYVTFTLKPVCTIVLMLVKILENLGPGKWKINEIMPCVVSYEGVPIVNFGEFVQKFHFIVELNIIEFRPSNWSQSR